jgi:hypothetical protein
MKKFKWLQVLMITLIAGSLITLNSCKDDDDDVKVDKTELATKIQVAEGLIESTEEGTAEGQYMPGSKADLQTVIDVAKVVYEDANATQTEVDNTVIALQAAIDVYNSRVVEAIAPEALVGHWTFDDATGTTLTDFSGNSFHGTLMSGADTWGGGLPAWTTDRYGNEGKALSFDQGAYVKIPNNPALCPQNISIALWVNAAEILENNRFIGMHSWNGYKFQLQSVNKAFFTIATSDGIYDRDTDPPLEINTWYHVTVTFGVGNMVFYVNGTETQVWDNTPGTAVSRPNDLVFGRDSDEYAADDSNYGEDLIIPLAWGGFFHGKMDEVRMYNTVLTAAQVQSIYNLEKPE